MNELPQDTVNVQNPVSASVNNSSADTYLPEDLFAGFHFTYYPRFKHLTKTLSKTRLLKLLWAIGDVPNAEKMDRNFTKEQKESYLILDKLLLAKFSLVFNTMYKEAEKQQAEADAKAPNNEGVSSGQ